MKVRLQPADEYTHDPGSDSSFNESMYLNFYDPGRAVGGFFRIGNRVNEGYAEVTLCLYLPYGKVAFTYGRPSIDTNDRLDSGGLRISVIEPFRELALTFGGNLTLLTDPLQMADPKAAFTANPSLAATADLRFVGVAPMFGGEPESPDDHGDQFARAHYEQLVACNGDIAIGESRWEIDGFGLRDHSWGPRSWQAPWYYRWLTGNVGADFGFMASIVVRRDCGATRGGFVWDQGQLHLCSECEISTVWTPDDLYHHEIGVALRSAGSQWQLKGTVLNLIPLRNRRDGMTTRLAEGMTEWRGSDGRVGFGLSEYLDQIVDGRPVGMGS